MRKILAVGAIIAVLAYGIMLFVPQPVPLVDANRQVLATTPREGYCAGTVFMDTRSQGSEEQMHSCLQNEEDRPNEENLDAVQRQFCRGVYDRSDYPQEECISIMEGRQYWPTMKGTITNAWNKRFPYPLANTLDAISRDDSRTGERDSNERNGIAR